jgi:hypothetical protein
MRFEAVVCMSLSLECLVDDRAVDDGCPVGLAVPRKADVAQSGGVVFAIAFIVVS